jgi:RNase H-fold protein (predicted Holliday junction resolvase)
MFYLGIDWGQSKCGLAIADQENRIASVYRQVKAYDIFKEIFDLIEGEEIIKIIVGYNEKLLKRKIFKEFLAEIKKMKIPVELENEDFSTQMAHQNLIDADRKNIFRRDDVESSRIILQSWLDKKAWK